jgi:cytochrome c-type biogenesis protein
MLALFVAITAGVVSFLSPCVLPLIPGYLTYLASASGVAPRRSRVFAHSLSFAVGFSLVFALVGVALTTILDAVAFDAQIWLARSGGILIIVFGLYLAGIIPLPWLAAPRTITVRRRFASPYLTSAVFGAAFAAGWTPCVGAVLGSILGLATTQPGSAFVLLLGYAVGFSVPLLIVGLCTKPAIAFIQRFGAAAAVINKLFGFVLVLLGILVFTQTLSRLGNFEYLLHLLGPPV